MAEVEKLQRALKKMIDLFFADLVRSEQLLQVEVREASIGHPRRQKFPQAAGIDGSECPDFFEDHALKWVFKYSGIEQPANLKARPALDQHRAEKPQRVSLELKSAVCFSSMHWNALKRAFSMRLHIRTRAPIELTGNAAQAPRIKAGRSTINEMILGWTRLRSGENEWGKNIVSSFSAADSAGWRPRKS